MNSELLDRLPPMDLDSEKGVIGSLILDSSHTDSAALIVRPQDFHSDSNRKLFAALVSLADDRKPADAVLVAERLAARGELENVGGPAYIAEVMQSVAVSAHVEYYAGIVRKLAKYRTLIHAATAVLQQAYGGRRQFKADDGTEERRPEPGEIVAKWEADLLEMVRDKDVGPTSAREAAVQALLEVDEIVSRRHAAGEFTGLDELDQTLGGLFRSEVCYLAARPGIGKTALACQLAAWMSGHGRRVAFFSMEMTAKELLKRVICSQAEVDSRRLRSGAVDDEDRALMGEAAQPLATELWQIYDQPTFTVSEIRRWSLRQARDGPLGLVVIDYLGLLTPRDTRSERRLQVGELTRDVKALSRELDSPLLVITHLNRLADGVEPRLSHLAESGSIEQNADAVWFLRQANDDEQRERGEHVNAILDVAKNRNSVTRRFPLIWTPEFTRFESMTQHARHGDFGPYIGQDGDF